MFELCSEYSHRTLPLARHALLQTSRSFNRKPFELKDRVGECERLSREGTARKTEFSPR